MRFFLLGLGWLQVLVGVDCAIAAPWSGIPLFEALMLVGSAVSQTGGIITLTLAYTDDPLFVLPEEELEESRGEIARSKRRRKTPAVPHREETRRRGAEILPDLSDAQMWRGRRRFA